MLLYLAPLFVVVVASSLILLLYMKKKKGKAVRDPQKVAEGMFAIYGGLYAAMAEHVLERRSGLDHAAELQLADECHKFAYAALVKSLNQLDNAFRRNLAWRPFISQVGRAMVGSWAQVAATHGKGDAKPVLAHELNRYLATWDVLVDKVDYNLASAAPQPLRPLLPTALFPDGRAGTDEEGAAYQEAEALAHSLLQQAQEKLRSIW